MQIPQPVRRPLSLDTVFLPRDPGEAVRLKSVAKLVGSDGPLVARMITPEQFAILLPLACVCAEEQERIILRDGVALATAQIGDAKRVGITHPERVRLRVVDQILMPTNPVLRAAAEMTGLISPLTAGSTLRYGIFIRSDFWGERRPSRSGIPRRLWNRKQNGLKTNCATDFKRRFWIQIFIPNAVGS